LILCPWSNKTNLLIGEIYEDDLPSQHYPATADMSKLRVLIVGCGGVGTIAALNLESGGKAAVTAVLRSNFNIVAKRGFIVRSIDYGHLEGWRPSQGEISSMSR
jgi:glutamate dehydrogenase/leucine dehydrogenase